MSFANRNFIYVTKPFGEFIDEVVQSSRQYLRSVSAENAAERPANLDNDYPTIARDFEIPSVLGLVVDNLHSSVLRISGPVNMWLHYDVS